MTVRRGVSMRRTLVLGTVCLAVLFAGAIGAIHVLTGDRSAGAPAPALEASAAPPPGAAARAASTPRVGAALRAARVRAPRPSPVAPLAGEPPTTRAGTTVPRTSAGMKVSFEMESRVTSGLHMGARWVSPPTYVATQEGNLFTVRARAHGVDAGRALRDMTWLPSEPDMVAVTPDRGGEVEIAVLREGRSTLTVAEGSARETLTVNAVQQAGVWRVDISK
jgi:hypothetical protein